jgi:hypothetical protein
MTDGWTKVEKKLLTDPRITRIAFDAVTDEQYKCNAAVTLALGAIVRLWLIADEHATNDNVLAFGIEAINKLVGVTNFCQLVDSQWLEIIDAQHVKLPKFHEHNGTQAKKSALAQKRMKRYRERERNTTVANASLDQDQDQDLRKKNVEKKKSLATRLPEGWTLTADNLAYAQKLGLNGEQTHDAFCDYWRASNAPAAAKRDWSAAWRTWCRRALTMSARGFTGNGAAAPPLRDVAQWSEARARAKAISFRDPFPHETAGGYLTAIKLAEMPQRSLTEILAQRSQAK